MSEPGKDGKASKSEPRITRGEGLAAFEEKIRRAIAYRAYALFESRGRDSGHDMEDWFTAERELLKPLSVEIADAGGQIRLRAGVLGFGAPEIELGVSPRRLIIWGEKMRPAVPETARLFDEIDLPAAIDANRAEASVSNGVLELRAPKAPPEAA
ncbi:MAG: DUF2934 domain-containing protein [Terriglobia bacterium]